MEGVLPPSLPVPSFEAMGPEMGGLFRTLKDPVQGPALVIQDNLFVESVLPGFHPAGPFTSRPRSVPSESARRPNEEAGRWESSSS